MMHRSLICLFLSLAIAGCKPAAPAGPMTGKKTVRYILLKNNTERTLSYDLSFNGAEAERIQLPAHNGVFVYELLPASTAYAKLPPTEVTFASPDGVKLSFKAIACELESVPLGTEGVTAKGEGFAESERGVPGAEFLDKENLSAQQVPKLRKFDVKIVAPKRERQ